MNKNNKNLYLDVLEWAYNNSVDGFTEKEILEKFNFKATVNTGWYLKVFRNSGNGNAVLIDNFCNRINGLQEFKLSEAPSRAKRLVKENTWLEKRPG